MTPRIREAQPRDQARWSELFDGYNLFYGREPSAAINRHTWARIQDASAPVHGIVAESAGGEVIAIVNYVIHESTTTALPVCYLRHVHAPQRLRALRHQMNSGSESN